MNRFGCCLVCAMEAERKAKQEEFIKEMLKKFDADGDDSRREVVGASEAAAEGFQGIWAIFDFRDVYVTE